MQNGAPSHMAANGQAGNNWLQPNSASPSHQFTGPQLAAGGMQIPPTTPLQHQAQPANGQAGMPGQGLLSSQQPPRSAPTPLQHMSNTGNPIVQRSPNMAASMGGVSAQPPMGLIPPQAQASQGPRPNTYPAMPGPAFQAAYSQYCQKHGIQHDEQLLHIEGKRIDLHRLHQEVIAAGTSERVSRLRIIVTSGIKSLPPSFRTTSIFGRSSVGDWTSSNSPERKMNPRSPDRASHRSFSTFTRNTSSFSTPCTFGQLS